MTSHPNVNVLLTGVLKANGIVVLDFTAKTHAIPMRFPLYLRPGNPIGIVMHNTSGLIDLNNLVGTWANKTSPPPSHLAIDQSGRVAYFVSLNHADRATENTNKHISIEFQAVENGDISQAQIKSSAIIYGFLHDVYGIEFAVANTRQARGLAHHSIFVNLKDPEAHANCPGAAILARKPEIIELAKKSATTIDFGDEPTGLWQVRVDRWLWIYQFGADGTVTWRDPYNGRSGTGTWKTNSGKLSFSWKGSKTVETWDLPLSATAQTGACQMEDLPLHRVAASRKMA